MCIYPTFIILGGYPNGYGTAPWLPGGESRKDCAIVPGLDSALCFAFRSDNTGPPTTFSVISFFYSLLYPCTADLGYDLLWMHCRSRIKSNLAKMVIR